MSARPDVATRTERRRRPAPHPPDLDTILNKQQARTLHEIETFGWQLAFVRNSRSHTPLTIVISPDGERLAVLEPDGRVDMQPEVDFREQSGTPR